MRNMLSCVATVEVGTTNVTTHACYQQGLIFQGCLSSAQHVVLFGECGCGQVICDETEERDRTACARLE